MRERKWLSINDVTENIEIFQRRSDQISGEHEILEKFMLFQLFQETFI